MAGSPHTPLLPAIRGDTVAHFHVDDKDPTQDRVFTEYRIDPDTSRYELYDITDRVFYLNAATGVLFMYNSSHKNDPLFGYASRPKGWFAIAGATSR